MLTIDPHIFRAYDIRGKALSELTPQACHAIARAFATVLFERYGDGNANFHPTVAIGRDARTHSPLLEGQVVAGLAESGCRILRIGMTPSPVNYFTICKQSFDGGVQVTASHNPKEDNGLKLQVREAEAFSGEDLQDLRHRIEQGVFRSSQGSVEELDAASSYREALRRLFPDVGRGLKVVVDSGNGVAGPTYVHVLRETGCEVLEMYTEPDGEFPHHPADPSKHATLKELQKKVAEVGADLGFAYDGDGDRMGLVDERGQIVSADHILLLLAQDHLARHPGAPIIFTVSNSGLLESEVKKWGGVPVMCRVGHSFVEHAMREHGAKLGGEQSGHFFCAEGYYGFDDALVATLRILKILQSPPSPLRERVGVRGNKIKNKPPHPSPLPRGEGTIQHPSLSQLISRFPTVYQSPERRPFCPDDKKFEVVRSLSDHFASRYPVNTLDGARVDFGSGAWAGIRASNTSPALSICIEARSEEKLKEVEELILNELKNHPALRF